MNTTEELAYHWLKEHGATGDSIVFQAHKSPDFITSIGKFEVKRTSGRCVVITKNQVKMLETEDVTFLVYKDKSELPLKLSLSEFREQFTIAYELMQPIKISDENRKKLLQLKLDMNLKSVDAVITELLKRA